MARKQTSGRLSDQLREAIRTADVTQYRLAKEIGVSQALLSRFLNGDVNLSLDTADRVAEFLGLRLTKDRPPRRIKTNQ